MQDSTESRGGFRLSVLFYKDENEKKSAIFSSKDILIGKYSDASCPLSSSLFYEAENGNGTLYGLFQRQMERKRAGSIFSFTMDGSANFIVV